MRYHDPNKKNGTIVQRTVCAVLFCAFSFLWLYYFQADVLAVAQHVLSDAQTSYDRRVGAVLLTAVLQLLALLVYAVVRLRHRTHALCYFPSMLVLAFVSDVNADIDRHFSLGAWWWVGPLVLAVWGAVVWLCRQMLPFDNGKGNGFSFRFLWLNVLLMLLMMLGVVAVANTNAVFHFRAHAEVALSERQVDEALRVGERSHETDASLTMLRAYALSLKGEMGERLFKYPIAGRGDDLLPLKGSQSHLQLLAPDSLYCHLGGRPGTPMTTQRYLALLERDSLATPAVADYRLCALLIDRRLDEFAALLSHYYAIDAQLPLHYREALTLYNHLRETPVVEFSDSIMEEDWADLQELEAGHPLASERKLQARLKYMGTYWYYYYYCY